MAAELGARTVSVTEEDDGLSGALDVAAEAQGLRRRIYPAGRDEYILTL